MRALVLAEAEAELEEAALYLDGQRPGYGTRLLTAFQKARDYVLEHPLAGHPGELGTRSTPLANLRHDLVYIVRGDLLVVVAVAHYRCRPRYWSDRLS